MKLELNKKYVDGNGAIHEVGSTMNNVYVAYCEKYETLSLFSDKGVSVKSSFDYQGRYTGHDKACDLVKEHVEPRTKDVWVVWYRSGKTTTSYSAPIMVTDEEAFCIKKITLTEGEYDE